MTDEERPRRPKSDELEEIAAFEAKINDLDQRRWPPIPPAVNPTLPLSEVVARMEADEEAAFQARERAETPSEQEESHRILMIEAEIEDEIPLLRRRELQRTFGAWTADLYYAAATPSEWAGFSS